MSGATARGLLLDLDGTLVDSLDDLAGALNALRAELGLPTLDRGAIEPMVGDGVAKLVARGLADGGIDATQEHIARLMTLYGGRLTRHTRPYPGVAETLPALAAAGWRLGLCTNKPEAPARAILAAFDLTRHFAVITGGDSFAARKPDPGHALQALARMGCAPAAAVLVGDSHVDLATGRNAGLPVVLMSYGYARAPVEELGADRVLARFSDLPETLDKLCR